MNFEKDVRIDETALDVEIIKQPELAVRYKRYYTKCSAEVANIKARLDLKESNLTTDAYNNPSLLGEDVRATKDTVAAYVKAHPAYKKLNKKYLEALRTQEDAETFKHEIAVTRRNMLSLLVDLYKAEYFAGPSSPRNLTKEVEKRELLNKKANKKIKNGSKRKN